MEEFLIINNVGVNGCLEFGLGEVFGVGDGDGERREKGMGGKEIFEMGNLGDWIWKFWKKELLISFFG